MAAARSSLSSFSDTRYQIPDPLAQWPGAHKYAIILHFPLLRSIFIFIFIFIYLQMAFAAALRSHAHFAMFMALATFGRRQQIDFYTKMRVHTYLFMRHIYLLIHIFILIYMHNLHLTYFYGAFADGQEKSKYFIRHGNVLILAGFIITRKSLRICFLSHLKFVYSSCIGKMNKIKKN